MERRGNSQSLDDDPPSGSLTVNWFATVTFAFSEVLTEKIETGPKGRTSGTVTVSC